MINPGMGLALIQVHRWPGKTKYAYCRIGSASNGCSFFLSCVFQNDGTTNFGKIPSSDEIDFSNFDNCPTEALPKKRNKKSDAQKPSTLYS
jgi:hypothetical protein